jgi:hypothetical protein
MAAFLADGVTGAVLVRSTEWRGLPHTFVIGRGQAPLKHAIRVVELLCAVDDVLVAGLRSYI